MIQIYKPENTDFEKNGDMTLFPETATVHPILNGEWEIDLEHPMPPMQGNPKKQVFPAR